MFFSIGLSIGTPLNVRAQSSEQESAILPGWAQAREHYASGRYEEALLELQRSPSDDYSYFYNLGTIYYKMGKTGLAVAYLEKANRIQSHDFEVIHNLELARKRLVRELGNPQALDPASQWVESLTDNINADELRGLFGLITLVFGLLFFRNYWKTFSLQATFKHPLSWICVTALAAVFIVFISFKVAENHPPAIFLESSVLRSGPADTYLQLGVSTPGVKIRILGSTAPSGADGNMVWYQIRYTKDAIAWIPASSVLLL